MCNHEAQKCNFRPYLLLLKKCVLSFPVPIKQMTIFGQICRKIQISGFKEVRFNNHHPPHLKEMVKLVKLPSNCEASNFLAGEKPHFFLPKTLSNKNNLSWENQRSTSLLVSRHPSSRSLISQIGLSGRRVMRRKLEPMSPFGGEKRLTRYLGPRKMRVFLGYIYWRPRVAFFFGGGEDVWKPWGWIHGWFFDHHGCIFFLYEWICWYFFWILELASVIRSFWIAAFCSGISIIFWDDF